MSLILLIIAYNYSIYFLLVGTVSIITPRTLHTGVQVTWEKGTELDHFLIACSE